jgi:hypothetical protein
VPALPALADPAEVGRFWAGYGAAVRWTIVAAAVGYPLLLVFLADVAERSGFRRPVLAAVLNALVFVTALAVAFGLAGAGGLLDRDGYPLHVAAFLLAAPAAGCGTGMFVLLAVAAHRGWLRPRWLCWPACAAALANVGAFGGLFRLDGPWNSGNGLLGGIALPLGSFVGWVALACFAWLRPSHPG